MNGLKEKYDNILLLDLDGVLITTPPWKPCEVHEDGYSDFNDECVQKLNILVRNTGYDIVLSPMRRTQVDIDQMNVYFKNRGIEKPIVAYVPIYSTETIWYSRRREIEMFLEEHQPKSYLILDDDKSLLGAKEEIKANWIQTHYYIGLE